MIETGIDWSGDPGNPRTNPADPGYLVLVACSLESESRLQLQSELGLLKAEMRVSEHHVFKHLKSTQSTRDRYLQVLASASVRATALCIDKNIWSQSYYQNTRGPQRIIDAIVELVYLMTDDDVAGQRLLIDTKRAEQGFLTELRRSLRAGLARHGRTTFKKVSPRPDDRSDAILIQAADMVAGDLRRRLAKGLLDSVGNERRWTVVIHK